jgi:hypothetical protein
MAAWFDRNRHLYPDDWPEIAKAVKDKAGWRCEACNNPHGPSPYVLTVHHLNHDPSDCDDDNLVALCQRDHLRCQGMRPRPETREEAIERLRARYEAEQSQLTFSGFTAPAAGPGRANVRRNR